MNVPRTETSVYHKRKEISVKEMFVKIQNFNSDLVYVIKLIMRTSKLYFLLALFFSVLAGLSGTVQALFLKKILDNLAEDLPLHVFIISAAIIVVSLLINKVVSRLLFGLNRVVTDKIGYTLELNILESVEHISVAQMDNPAFLNKLEQARNLVKNQPNSIFMNIFGILTELAGLCGFFVILSQFHICTPFILIATAIPLFAVNNQYEENVMSFLFSMSPERRKMGYFSGVLTGRDHFEEVRAYHAAPFLRSQYKESMTQQLHKGWSIFRKNSIRYIGAAVLSYLGCFLVYVWILYEARSGHVSIGQVAMLISSCVGIQGLCVELVDGCAIMPSSLMVLRNYRTLISDLNTYSATPRAAELPLSDDSPYAVCFENVSFAYPGTGVNVLDNASFKIKKGDTVALVGVNGVGKTTIVKLILGLYDHYEGCILLGGTDSRLLTQQQRADFLSVMFQNYIKPNLALAEAVTFGGSLDQDRLQGILDSCGLGNQCDISQPLTKTFSPDGWIPSGGQWQKIALARMLYRDTPLLLLDEPSAALDPQSELELFQNISGFHHEKTVLFITHRLASITDADEVLFLSPGSRLVQGTHQQLLQENEAYSTLYHAQADRYMTENQA